MTSDDDGTQSNRALISNPTTYALSGKVAELKEAHELIAEHRRLLDGAETALKAALHRETALVARINHLEGVAADRESLAAQLRDLKRDLDPARIERARLEAVAMATFTIGKQLADAEGKLAHANREITELRASKKKLREALERAKEKK